MKLSSLKRILSLIVTVALITGLVVMPAYAELDPCAEEVPMGAPTLAPSRCSMQDLGDGSYDFYSIERPDVSTRIYFYPTQTYTFGAVVYQTDPTYVKTEFSMIEYTDDLVGAALTSGSDNGWHISPGVGVKKDYAVIADLQAGSLSLYGKENGEWGNNPIATWTASGTYSYFMFRTDHEISGEVKKLVNISNLSETMYTGTWDINSILRRKVVKYPTPTTRRADGVVTNVGEGSWTVTVNSSSVHGLALPLTGLKAFDANDYKTNFDPAAAFIKTEATLDANGANVFGSPEISALENNTVTTYSNNHWDNGSTLGDGANLGRDYYDTFKVTVIFDIANGMFYVYGRDMEPQQFSVVGGSSNFKVWEGDETIDAGEKTGYMLDWTKAAGAAGTINVTNFKQTVYYDKSLSIKDVYTDGVVDTETLDANVRIVDNKNPGGSPANATVARAVDSETWTITTTGEDANVKMLSGYLAPTIGYAATELSRNYADFVHFSATLEITEGAYEGYVLETLGNKNYFGYIANVVYGNNGLPAFVLGEEYDIDMIYDVKTGETYVYVNDVLCKIRDLSSPASFTGVGLTFTGVTSPVTAVVTNPSFKYYNKSASANIATVTAGLDNNGFKLNYKDLAAGKAKAQFYGNLADECYVIAVYEGDVLKSASKVDFDGVAREIEANVGAGQTAKLFVWDADTLAPVVAPYSF